MKTTRTTDLPEGMRLKICTALKTLHEFHSASGDAVTRFHNDKGQCDVYILTVHRFPELYNSWAAIFGTSEDAQ